MDPKPAATTTSRSAELASAGPHTNVRKTLKKMTGAPIDKSSATQHSSDKSASTPHATDKLVATQQHASGRKSTGKGEHSGTGTSRKRKRKKSSGATAPAVPRHPSVLEAGAYTKRQEQVEEARARETVYLTPRAEIAASGVEETRDSTENSGSSAGAPSTGIVIAEVEETEDTTSNTGPSEGDSALAGGISRALAVEETTDTASNAGSSAGDIALGGSVSRARRPWEWSAKDCDAVLVDVLSRARSDVEFSEEELTEENISASSFFGVDVGRSSTNRKGHVGSGGGETSNGKVGGDERKAREVSAALNRNNPRGRTSRNKLDGGAPPPRARRSIGKVRASSRSRGIPDDEQEAKNLNALLNRNRPRRGLRSPGDGVRSEGSDTNTPEEDRRIAGGNIRCELGNNGTESTTTVLHTNCTLKGGKERSRADKGVPLRKGSAAEVLWDDRKWYRVTLSSISAEGTHGVLEFLPYGRRNYSREFSSELELGEWVRAGKLVLPGTHLKWD